MSDHYNKNWQKQIGIVRARQSFKQKIKSQMNELQTGDLILFSGKSMYSYLIEWTTRSDFSHCGIVLRDPSFIHPSLKGLYLWESTWKSCVDSEDNELKSGVLIRPLYEAIADYKGSTYFRHLLYDNCDTFENGALEEIHKMVHGRPYDVNPLDWLEAFVQKDPSPQKTDRMFCSAFVARVYTECGILDKDTDWSIVRPSDFGVPGDENLLFNDGFGLGEVQQLKSK